MITDFLNLFESNEQVFVGWVDNSSACGSKLVDDPSLTHLTLGMIGKDYNWRYIPNNPSGAVYWHDLPPENDHGDKLIGTVERHLEDEGQAPGVHRLMTQNYGGFSGKSLSHLDSKYFNSPSVYKGMFSD